MNGGRTVCHCNEQDLGQIKGDAKVACQTIKEKRQAIPTVHYLEDSWLPSFPSRTIKDMECIVTLACTHVHFLSHTHTHSLDAWPI